MSEQRNSWECLERRHRTEEIWEVFGIAAQVDLTGTSVLPSDSWTRWNMNGQAASAEALAESATKAGLQAKATPEGVQILDTDGSTPASFSDKLHGWLMGIYEENPQAFLTRVARKVSCPDEQHLPQSAAWLERYYGGEKEFMPREKKPLVADLNRSHGAYLASVDDEPLVIMDAMSQIATLAAGFSPPIFQKALDEGEMDGVIAGSNWNSASSLAERRRFESEVQKHLPDALCHFAYANSGAEANEKAYILARLFGPGGKRVLAFEGSFHGRTLLSLYSTWNKVKREPYQIKGYEVEFIPFPGFSGKDEPAITGEWIEYWGEAGERPCALQGQDELMDKEIACLTALRTALAAGDICAVNLEPMQSEGGDNYGSARFFNGIRALTRAYGVPMIMDEVQTGFGLGGTFFWHQQFKLQRADGTPDHPDLVICAKKAQVGVTISVWPDPFPTPCQGASAIRGRLHAELGWRDHRSCEVHGLAEKGLAELEKTMPEGLVSGGRCSGYAFALDLPSAAIADAMVAQRFYRGAMVYKAGAHTLRYRLSKAFNDREIAAVFQVIRDSLEAVIEWAGGVGNGGQDLFDRMSAVKVPSWVAPNRETGGDGTAKATSNFTIRTVSGTEFDVLADQIEDIEKRSYEPERQDDIETLGKIAKSAEAISLVAEAEGKVVGFSFAGPLENFRHVQGPDADAEMDRQTTLYSADVTVDPDFRGCGVGSKLKEEQLRQALGARDASGHARFSFVTGRNRVGHTAEMSSINTKFGAYTVATFTGQYGSAEGVAEYYRIPLRRMDRRVEVTGDVGGINLEDGILEPLEPLNEELNTGLARGCFNGAMLTKLTLSNFTTPNVCRYVELMKEVRPEGMEHMYLTSCRDEMIDKAIRTLRSHRKEGEVCLSFSGAFLGQTTAGARSLSDWADVPFGERMPWFDWPQVTHPTGGVNGEGHVHEEVLEEGVEKGAFTSGEAAETFLAGLALESGTLQDQIRREVQCLVNIQHQISEVSAERIIGVFAEPVQERTGQTFTARMWRGLARLLETHDVPLVMDEVTTGMGRSGHGMWRSNTLPVQPEVILYYGGGQIGHVFVSDRYFLPKPLQLISTWDGDEVSALRIAWLLRALRGGDHQTAAQAFEKTVRSAGNAQGCTVKGEGYFLAIECADGRAEQVRSSLRSKGYKVGSGAGNSILLVPSLTRHWDEADLTAFSEALAGAL